MVSWLLDGFNALVLTYGQACSGKSTLMLGSRRALSPSSRGRIRAVVTPDVDQVSRDVDEARSNGHQLEPLKSMGGDTNFAERNGEWKKPTPPHDAATSPGGSRGWLLKDILRALFDNAAETSTDDNSDGYEHDDCDDEGFPSAEMAPDADLTGVMQQRAADGYSREPANGSRCAVDPLPGKSEQEHRAAAAAVGQARDVVRRGRVAENNGCFGPGDKTVVVDRPCGMEGVRPSGRGRMVVALSAWEMTGNAVRDLLQPPGVANSDISRSAPSQPESLKGLAAKEEMAADDKTYSVSFNVQNSSRTNNSGNNSAHSNGSSHSHSHSHSNSSSNGNRNTNGNATSNEAGGGGGHDRGRRDNIAGGRFREKPEEGINDTGDRGRNRGESRDQSKGRSGRKNASGSPWGNPDGFWTVKAPNLATALNLVEIARRRRAGAMQDRALVEAFGGGKGGQAETGGGGGRGRLRWEEEGVRRLGASAFKGTCFSGWLFTIIRRRLSARCTLWTCREGGR